jgi:hypothetical protein
MGMATLTRHSGTFRSVAAPEAARSADFAAASDADVEIHARFFVAGTAFKAVLLAVFGLDEILPAEQRVTPRAAEKSREVRLFCPFCEPLT